MGSTLSSSLISSVTTGSFSGAGSGSGTSFIAASKVAKFGSGASGKTARVIFSIGSSFSESCRLRGGAVCFPHEIMKKQRKTKTIYG